MDDGAMFVITNRIYLNLMKRFKVPDKYYVSAEHSSKLSLTLQTGWIGDFGSIHIPNTKCQDADLTTFHRLVMPRQAGGSKVPSRCRPTTLACVILHR